MDPVVAGIVIAVIALVVAVISLVYQRKATVAPQKEKETLRKVDKALKQIIDKLDYSFTVSTFRFYSLQDLGKGLMRYVADEKLFSCEFKLIPKRFYVEGDVWLDANRKETIRNVFYPGFADYDFLLFIYSYNVLTWNAHADFEFEPFVPLKYVLENLDLSYAFNEIWDLSKRVERLSKYKDLVEPFNDHVISDMERTLSALIASIFKSVMSRRPRSLIVKLNSTEWEVYDQLYQMIMPENMLSLVEHLSKECRGQLSVLRREIASALQSLAS